MSPNTKKTYTTRDSASNSTGNSVPIVSSAPISKSKPASALTRKQTNSKLEEISRQALQSQLPSATPSIAGSTTESPVLISDNMDSTFDSDAYHLQQTSVPDSQFEISTQPFAASLPAGMSEWLNELQSQIQQHSHLFESQNSRIHNIESLLQENAELKETVAAQASEIAELRSRLLNVPTTIMVEEHMTLDTPRDLSTNGSKWRTAPSTLASIVSPQISSTKPKRVVQAKPTFAQVASKPVPAPKKKKKPIKKPLNQEQLVKIGRPFAAPTEGPNGFKYVYIGRSRKITRADTRSRFKQVGVDNSRVLDINFPAHGVIGVLVHLQYVETFEKVMTKIGAQLIKNFDPLDPIHLANPIYESYSSEAREDIALSLQYNRCMNALLYLRNTRPHQVKPVGFSLVELGFISEEDVLKCASLTPQDPKDKISLAAGALFTGPVKPQDGMDQDHDKGEGDHDDEGSAVVMEEVEDSTVVHL